jgi:hypothetical protein
MAKDALTGLVCLPKALFSDDLWHCEPFSLGQAWIDLWSLANDRKRLLRIRGNDVIVDRGQCAWSIVKLADRWHWGRPKVSKFLLELQDARKIMVKTTNVTTILTVLDYTAYNPDTSPELPIDRTPERTADGTAEETPNRTPERTADGTADGTQKIGRYEGGSKEDGRGEGPNAADSLVPSNEEVAAFCASWPGDLARGIPGRIPDMWWTGWLAARLSSDRAFPQHWKRVLALAFASDWINGHPKARGTGMSEKNAASGSIFQTSALRSSNSCEGDQTWWWTDSISAVEGALSGALLGGDKKNAARLREVLQERTKSK